MSKTLFCFIILSFILFSCQEKNDINTQGPIITPDQDTSSWAIINNKIFKQNCVSCHVAGNSYAMQSDLILTPDVAYEQLINREPKNSAAKEDGLLLLGQEGLVSLNRSFLWEKINARDREHFYSDHPYYGSQMPLGPTPLTNGELDFIREWILAGAPDTGHVANVDLLLDTSRYEAPEFAKLDSPENGFQFHVGPFDVDPNVDYEFFYYEPALSNEDIFINKVEIVMRPGSHHFIAYTFDQSTPSNLIPESRVFRDVYDENGDYIIENLIGTTYHQFVAGTQWPVLNYNFPPGVALRLPAGSGLDLNSHYANNSSETVTGEVYMNLHTLEESQVQLVAEILQLNNQNIVLPPNKTTTLTKNYYFNERVHIFQLFSHAHEHMTEFKVYAIGGPRDGELVYVSYDWEHPPILEIDPALVIEKNDGLKIEVTYVNDEDRTITFGLRSTDEMMILFGAYFKI